MCSAWQFSPIVSQSARAGNSALVRKIVEDYDLDVNGRETMPKQPLKKPNVPINVETLLHTSARACDAELMLFLLQRGVLSSSSHFSFF